MIVFDVLIFTHESTITTAHKNNLPTKNKLANMKFRAVCKDSSHMREIVSIVTALSRISRDAACILQNNRITFIVSENAAQSIPLTWADIGTDEYFPEYQMEGVAAAAGGADSFSTKLPVTPSNKNQIVLTMNIAKFVLALTALNRSASPYLKLKLTDNQFPCLSVVLERTADVTLQHNVPVVVVPVRDWCDYQLPREPADLSAVTITMPALRQLRNLVDNFRKLSPAMMVYCSRTQNLSLVSESDLATVACHYRTVAVRWSSRKHPVIDDDDADDDAGAERNEEDVACRIATKQMATFLGSIQQGGAGIMSCNISQDRMVKLSLNVREHVTLNSLLPELCL